VTARRIERDQHDGVQQHLIALMAAIETARHTQGPTQASVSLNAARDVGQGAVVELRSVISGILPPVLADGGLVAAVRARAGQLHLPVIVKVGDGAQARFTREVEIAAYFCNSEALVNVVRHADAANACVEVKVSDDRLSLKRSLTMALAEDNYLVREGIRGQGPTAGRPRRRAGLLPSSQLILRNRVPPRFGRGTSTLTGVGAGYPSPA
jgi:glucose-6-phosphate-specific signal transduction histidine kinase